MNLRCGFFRSGRPALKMRGPSVGKLPVVAVTDQGVVARAIANSSMVKNTCLVESVMT